MKTKYFLGAYEKEVTSSGTKEIHYIPTGGGSEAVYVVENGIGAYYYLYKDHLGSVVAVTNGTGTVVYEQNFDAWGRRRDASGWTHTSTAPPTNFSWVRGFTGHEHLDDFGLINMNGRMYDPILGRMLAVDNFVQDPYFSQNYNRYSYCYNNPLTFTDPTGEMFWVAPVIAGAITGAAVGTMYRHATDPNASTGDIIKSGLNGMIIGASIGYGYSSLMTAAYVPGAGGNLFFEMKPIHNLGKYTLNSTAFKTIMTNALMNSAINMSSYTIQTAVNGKTFSSDRLLTAGVIGLGAGIIGGAAGTWNGYNFGTIGTPNQLSALLYTTAMLNGGADRLITGIQSGQSPWHTALQTIGGIAEGAMAATMARYPVVDVNYSNIYKSGIKSSTKLTLITSSTTQFVTSVPGLSHSLFSLYAPSKGFLSGNGTNVYGGLFSAGLNEGANFLIDNYTNEKETYYTRIGNLVIAPLSFYFWNEMH